MLSSSPAWHLLQYSNSLDFEFGAALSDLVPVVLWRPERGIPGPQPPQPLDDGGSRFGLRVSNFRVLPGLSRLPVSLLARTGSRLAAHLEETCDDPAHSPLICTNPYFAPVAERWPGPVIYRLTDYLAAPSEANRLNLLRLDRRLCAAATLVCPNSERLADYLVHEAGCRPDKICVLPNATRLASLLPDPPSAPAPLPPVIAHLPRPVAGILGNLAGDTDWVLLEKVASLLPELSWAFVGSTEGAVHDREQERARASLMRHPRAVFTGGQPHAELVRYARAIDVAVLPYLRREPTYSGSSTPYYEHLAACRPIIAFPGVHELCRKPYLKLTSTAEHAAGALRELMACRFDDGLTRQRWQASRSETWHSRARTLRAELQGRTRMQLAS